MCDRGSGRIEWNKQAGLQCSVEPRESPKFLVCLQARIHRVTFRMNTPKLFRLPLRVKTVETEGPRWALPRSLSLIHRQAYGPARAAELEKKAASAGGAGVTEGGWRASNDGQDNTGLQGSRCSTRFRWRSSPVRHILDPRKFKLQQPHPLWRWRSAGAHLGCSSRFSSASENV